MHSQLKKLKRNLLLNCKFKEEIKEPTKEFLEEKWNEITSNFINILKEGKSQQVFQEIYIKINDLLNYEIPQTIIDNIEKVL